MLSNVIEFRERVAEALDGTITMTRRVLLFSACFVLLLFAGLSASHPFWLRNLFGMNSRVVWVPHDPDNKQRWALHSEAQDEALFRMKCREIQEGGGVQLFHRRQRPDERGTKRPRR